MTKTLTLAIDNFDQQNTFNVAVVRKKQGRLDVQKIKCQLRRNYHKNDDGIYWAMSVGGVLKDVYTDQDKAERARLLQEKSVANGDLVLIDGKEYKAKVLGAYSDACVFVEV